MSRLLVGLSVGSAADAVSVAAVRAAGVGWDMTPAVEHAARRPLAGLGIADAAGAAVRDALAAVGRDMRAVFAVGLHVPAGVPADGLAERISEQTGLTVVSGFAARDVAAGGSGRPVHAAADYLLTRSKSESRLLIHLGPVSAALWVPAGGSANDLVGFDAGPGVRLLDDLVRLGTQGKDAADPGGTRAVQGRCLDDLLAGWQWHPYLTRRPPKAVPPGEFEGDFLTAAFDAARAAGGSLPDLLCTATHFVARCVGSACRRWLPAVPRGVYVSGGGGRNGFLWQLLQQQFGDDGLKRSDEIGLPTVARPAAGAAVLAALTLDGVTANLPLLTGAAGGRLVGRIVPGDPRHWATVAAWAADQVWEYAQVGRAA